MLYDVKQNQMFCVSKSPHDAGYLIVRCKT